MSRDWSPNSHKDDGYQFTLLIYETAGVTTLKIVSWICYQRVGVLEYLKVPVR